MLSSETAIEGLKPAGLLQGRDPVGGGSPESAEADVYATVAAVRGGEAESPIFFTSRYAAAALAQLQTSGGVRVFPDRG